jgi:DNA invertase Pin-like site-specific DNA recombinase
MSNGRKSLKTNLNSASSFPKDITDKTNVFRAAIYARTNQADQSDSYVQQVKCCSEYVREKGWRLVDLFLDEGMSGKAIERPKLRLMLTKAAQYSFEVVVVSSLDRISRSRREILLVHKILRDFHVALKSVNDPKRRNLT